MITAGSDAEFGGRSSYPGGKSGAGIYQRLINLIPPHRVLVVPFAGHCGVTRNIKPAEHTIVIDQNPKVCEWWASWSRSKRGRALEIHNCDGIEWLRVFLGCTEYSASGSGDRRPSGEYSDSGSSGTGSRNRRLVMASVCDRMSPNPASTANDAELQGTSRKFEFFVFCDPPYVLSERATGKIYECELTDQDHERLLGTVTNRNASRYPIMICGYDSELYASLDPWNSIDHRVPTRCGLQDEKIWMNYRTTLLHDYRYIGNCRRTRERIRRRQINWRKQLIQMTAIERAAMLDVLNQPID
jgi:DNA adenine methylase